MATKKKATKPAQSTNHEEPMTGEYPDQIRREFSDLRDSIDRLYAIRSLLELAVSDEEETVRRDQVKAAEHFLDKQIEDLSNAHSRILDLVVRVGAI